MECQWAECVTANMKSNIGAPSLLLCAYPSCSNTPEPYANAYRIGASNWATISSSIARVELDTGRSWLRPNDEGRVGRAWCAWDIAGRGPGYRRVRGLGGCFAGGGGESDCGVDEETDSVARERTTKTGQTRRRGLRTTVDSIAGVRRTYGMKLACFT